MKTKQILFIAMLSVIVATSSASLCFAQDKPFLNTTNNIEHFNNEKKTTVNIQGTQAILNEKEPQIKFLVSPDVKNVTKYMCGPSHDEEVIYGLGSDGQKHYYAVGTDVSAAGILIMQSDDMLTWKRVGTVFNKDNPPLFASNPQRPFFYEFKPYTIENGIYKIQQEGRSMGNPNENRPFWAPCIYYHPDDQTYYLYYCASAFGTRNSIIGCAKSKTLDKGWKDCGILIHTRANDGKSYNAIDPVVVHDANGDPWMAYGSYFGGISIIRLNRQDPSKLLQPGTHGKTICCRGAYETLPEEQRSARARMERNHERAGLGTEGASIVYNKDTGYYYLFVAYDELSWSYHTRVGRSKKIDGPYLDFNGKPMIYYQDDVKSVYGTKIIGAYEWTKTGNGWAALGHTTLFYDKNNNLMFGSNSKWNGIPGSFMGVREVLWTTDGWPLLSPQLYAGENCDEAFMVSKKAISADRAFADWEFITFSVTHDTGRRTDHAKKYIMHKDGTVKDNAHDCAWDIKTTKQGVEMTVILPEGITAKGRCAYAWDAWRKWQTVVFSGLTENGIPVWGERITPPPFSEIKDDLEWLN